MNSEAWGGNKNRLVSSPSCYMTSDVSITLINHFYWWYDGPTFLCGSIIKKRPPASASPCCQLNQSNTVLELKLNNDFMGFKIIWIWRPNYSFHLTSKVKDETFLLDFQTLCPLVMKRCASVMTKQPYFSLFLFSFVLLWPKLCCSSRKLKKKPPNLAFLLSSLQRHQSS